VETLRDSQTRRVDDVLATRGRERLKVRLPLRTILAAVLLCAGPSGKWELRSALEFTADHAVRRADASQFRNS